MSFINEDLDNAIVLWICTFQDLTQLPDKIEQLKDGCILSEVLNSIVLIKPEREIIFWKKLIKYVHNAPSIISLQKISYNVDGDWALAMSNLDIIIEGLAKYYSENLQKPFDSDYVDTIKLAKGEDKEQIINLVECILGAAVQCEEKEKYINSILNLDDQCQTSLMLLIERALNRSNPSQDGEQANNISVISKASLLDEANKSNSASFASGSRNPAEQTIDSKLQSELLQKMQELETENANINEQLSNVAQERSQYKTKVKELQQDLTKRNEELRLLEMQREQVVDKLEFSHVTDDLQKEIKLKDFKLEEQDKYIEEIKQKSAIEVQTLNSDINELKLKLLQTSKVENTMEFYKQKYEESAKAIQESQELQKELSIMKLNNDDLTRKLEIVNTKLNSNKDSLGEERAKTVQLEVELQKRSHEIELLKNEKRRQEHNIDKLENELQEKIKENQLLQRNKSKGGDGDDNSEEIASSGENVLGQLAFDFQDLMKKLEKENEELKKDNQELDSIQEEKDLLSRENKVLKERLTDSELESEKLKNQLEQSSDVKTIDRLQLENKRLRDQIEILKKESSQGLVKDSGDSSDGKESKKSSSEISLLRNQLQEAMEKLQKKKDQYENEYLQELKTEIKSKEEKIKDLSEKAFLYDSISNKLKKAEETLRQKDKQSEDFLTEIEGLKGMLDEINDQKEQEIQTLTTAFYDIVQQNLELERELEYIQSNKHTTEPPKEE